MKTLFRFLLKLCFGFRAFNTAALDTRGPVLLVPNHVSWLDWLFLYVLLDDDWKFVTSSTTAQKTVLHRWMMLNRRTFPVNTTSPYAVREMAEYLERGGRLVLFAEGRISTTGGLMKLFEGTGFLIRKTNAAVVTCYLRGANRVRWVRHTGWKKWFPRVSAHFSDPLRAPALDHISATDARNKITTWVRDQLVLHQFNTEMSFGPPSVLSAVAETASHIPKRIAFEDASFTSLTYRRLLIGADALASVWRHQFSATRGERIGVMLPNVNALPATLLSLWAVRKTPALLNFSTGSATMLACIELAGLKHLITSREFLARAKIDPTPLEAAGVRLIFLEDIRPTISRWTKVRALLRHTFSTGANFLRSPLTGDETAVVLFTSGSEGTPKGVELTHRNLLANIRQATAVMDVTEADRFFNALPTFHSFGLTGGTLFPLVRGCYTFLYPTPLHYRIVPALVYDRSCTVLMGTNTFLNGYARKAHAYDFNSLRFLIAGAEKLQAATFETWAKKYGVRILEGYGATECSPIVSLNTRMDARVGTAGRLLPGIEARLEPVEGVTEGGRLFVRGPNIMKGYLNAEAQAHFLELGGWYDTGDIAHLDTDGFVELRGRLKRFAKVSGEMVSLTAIEDSLAGAFPQFGPRCQIAIVAVPDEDKGEKLIAVTNEPRLTLADARAVIRGKGLSNLSAPRELRVMSRIPKLGTGKTDHRELLRQLTVETEGR
jgi:acyl-[acyl-carrier-protein]-phospholipid O-acyltransferase/long-chain-fatty-acid--[acyl-carrier-protein] ligase